MQSGETRRVLWCFQPDEVDWALISLHGMRSWSVYCRGAFFVADVPQRVTESDGTLIPLNFT